MAAATTLCGQPHSVVDTAAAAAAAAAADDVTLTIYISSYIIVSKYYWDLILPQKSLGFLADTNNILPCTQINLYVA